MSQSPGNHKRAQTITSEMEINMAELSGVQSIYQLLVLCG